MGERIFERMVPKCPDIEPDETVAMILSHDVRGLRRHFPENLRPTQRVFVMLLRPAENQPSVMKLEDENEGDHH